MSDIKVCSKCGIEKPLTEDYFYKSSNKIGFQKVCKLCRNKYMKGWREDNADYLKNYEKNRPNRQERIKQNLVCHHLKKYERLLKQREYHKTHREEILNRQYKNREKNGIKYNEHHKEYRHTEKGIKATTKARIKRVGKIFGSNLLFENILDESEKIAFHHINDYDGIFIPDDLHRLFNCAQDVGRHRSNLLPIVLQLYPEIEVVVGPVF